MIVEKEKEDVVVSVLKSHSVDVTEKHNEKLFKIKQMIVNRDFTIKDWNEIVLKEFDEKTIVRELFNCSLGAYKEHLKYFKSVEQDLEAVRKGTHYFFATEEEAKAFHSDHHSPVLLTNDNSIGTTQFSVNEKMIIDGIVKGFTPEGLRAFCLDHYDVLLSVPNARLYAKEIGKLINVECQKNYSMFKGEDPIKAAARQAIREYCTKNNVSFGLSTSYEKDAEKLASSLTKFMGKEIAAMVLEPQSEKRISRVKKMFLKVAEPLTLPLYEQTVSFGPKGKTEN